VIANSLVFHPGINQAVVSPQGLLTPEKESIMDSHKPKEQHDKPEAASASPPKPVEPDLRTNRRALAQLVAAQARRNAWARRPRHAA
jgi:hypothetical protein